LISARASAFTARVAARRAAVVCRRAAVDWLRAVLRRRVAVPRFADADRCARPAAVCGRPFVLAAVVARRVVLRRRLEVLRAPEALPLLVRPEALAPLLRAEVVRAEVVRAEVVRPALLRPEAERAPEALRRDLGARDGVVAILGGPPRWILP
jgi:hypothetical protein